MPTLWLMGEDVIATPQDCHNRVWKVVGDSLKGSRDKEKAEGPWTAKNNRCSLCYLSGLLGKLN